MIGRFYRGLQSEEINVKNKPAVTAHSKDKKKFRERHRRTACTRMATAVLDMHSSYCNK